jgi:hypothetical protein
MCLHFSENICRLAQGRALVSHATMRRLSSHGPNPTRQTLKRKNDLLAEATWIADFLRHGLLRLVHSTSTHS